MLKVSEGKLARQCCELRYVYYLVTAFRLKRYSTWKRQGEPNPFVAKTYPERTVTEKRDFVDIFEHYRSER